MTSHGVILSICVALSSSIGEIRTDTLSIWQARDPVLSTIREPLSDNYTDVILNILNLHFRDSKTNFVAISKSCEPCDQIFALLMNRCNQSFFTINDISPTDNSTIFWYNLESLDIESQGFVIFLMSNAQNFFEYFKKVREMFAWNPRGKHLIVLVAEPSRKDIVGVFEEAWKYEILQVGVTVFNRLETYTYNPYLNDDFFETVNFSRLFYDKLTNMNGRPIRSKYVPYAGNNAARWIREEERYEHFGLDFGLAETFYANVNATPNYVNLTNEFMALYRDYHYRQNAWQERSFDNLELWFNLMPAEVRFDERSETSYPVGRRDLIVLVPKSKLKIPTIFEPYDTPTWMCILIVLVGVGSYTHLFYRRKRVDENAFLWTFGIFLGKGLSRRELCLIERITFLVFTTTSLLILSAYQGALYGALTAASYEPQIDSLDELYRWTNTLHTYSVVAEFLQANVPPGVIVEHFDSIGYLNSMLTMHHSAFVFPKDVASYTVRLKNLSSDGVPMYHAMTQYVMPAFSCLHFPYGSPYLEKLEWITRMCAETGLASYWENQADHISLLTGQIINPVTDHNTPQQMTLEVHLVSFYIWASGLFVSGLCCVTELFIHRMNLDDNKTTKIKTM